MSADEKENAKKVDWIPLLVITFVFISIIFSYLGLISRGFSPVDDALRHVAKVVSGKTWDQVLVFRDDFNGNLDTHPGWHAILNAFKMIGFGKDGLLLISIFIPWFLLGLVFVFFLKRAECFILVLLAFFVLDPDLYIRFFYGRPFLVSTAITVCYLFLWEVGRDFIASKRVILSTVLLSTVQVWVHPSWYLLALPMLVFFISGLLNRTIKIPLQFSICIAMGIIFGSILSLHPIGLLIQNINALTLAIFGDTPVIANEFKPLFYPNGTAMIIMIAFLSRLFINPWPGIDWHHPAIIMTLTSVFLGFFIGRFWSDWGFAGAMVWLTLDLQSIMERRIRYRHVSRLFIAVTASLLMVITISSIVGLMPVYNIDKEKALIQKSYSEDKSWFPNDGGVFYSNSMNTFYYFFYTMPEGNWRYILGYEQGLMPEEDRLILHSIKKFHLDGYVGWIRKMQPKDRLVIFENRVTIDMLEKHAELSKLEWKYVASNLLIGREKS